MNAFELYVKIGFNHILDHRLFTDILSIEGYDHMLFVVALAAVYQLSDYKKVIVLVTAFTIGHSITLILSTVNLMQIDPVLIEFLIPITILLTAVLNLFTLKQALTPAKIRIRYLAAILFGLIHGLGFSNYLKALLGNEDSIIVPLLGFNIGLELGQLLIVAMILVLQYFFCKLLRLKRNLWVMIVSVVVLLLIIPIILEVSKVIPGW